MDHLTPLQKRQAYRLANAVRIREYEQRYRQARRAARRLSAPKRYAVQPYLSTIALPPLSVSEAAYLAGFFDGEGSVGIYGGPSLELSVKVSGTHQDSIERFARAFGGKVYLSHRRKRTENEKTTWAWSIYSARAKVALAEMLPFLVVKKDEAFEALKCPVSRPSVMLSEMDREYKAVLAQRLRVLKCQVPPGAKPVGEGAAPAGAPAAAPPPASA